MGQLLPKMRAVIARAREQFDVSTFTERRTLAVLPTAPGQERAADGWYMPQMMRPQTVDACAIARCAYCKRYGPLGACDGCGAPNVPVEQPVAVLMQPGQISDRVAMQLRHAWEASSSGPGQSGRVVVLDGGQQLMNLATVPRSPAVIRK